MSNQLNQDLNKVISYLAEGAAWHCKAANELRKMPNKRGFARWHDQIEAHCDADKKIDLSKEITDYLKHIPVVDNSMVLRAEQYTINGWEGFKQHFDVWIAREKEFEKVIMSAITNSARENIAIYQCLCNLSKEVCEEIFRVELVRDSLAQAEWNHHHVAIVSMLIHEHVETKNNRDFNIG
jgi:hypothetical protein